MGSYKTASKMNVLKNLQTLVVCPEEPSKS